MYVSSFLSIALFYLLLYGGGPHFEGNDIILRTMLSETEDMDHDKSSKLIPLPWKPRSLVMEK